MAGPHFVPHPLPGDGGGPHPVQLQSLPEGRRAERLAEAPDPGPAGALDLLVGRRPQLCRTRPP